MGLRLISGGLNGGVNGSSFGLDSIGKEEVSKSLTATTRNLADYLAGDIKRPYFVSRDVNVEVAMERASRYLDSLFEQRNRLKDTDPESVNLEMFLRDFRPLLERNRGLVEEIATEISMDNISMRMLAATRLHHKFLLGHTLRTTLLYALAKPGYDYRIGLYHDAGKLALPRWLFGDPKRYDKKLAALHSEAGVRILLRSGIIDLKDPEKDQKDFELLQNVQHHHIRVHKGTNSSCIEGELDDKGKWFVLTDVFDALRYHRTYKREWESDMALAYLCFMSLTQKDRDELASLNTRDRLKLGAFERWEGKGFQLTDYKTALEFKDWIQRCRAKEDPELGTKAV